MRNRRIYLAAALVLSLAAFPGCATSRPKECARIHLIRDPEVEESVKTYLEAAWDMTKEVAQRTRSLLENGYARYSGQED